jgi:hypothetical protein
MLQPREEFSQSVELTELVRDWQRFSRGELLQHNDTNPITAHDICKSILTQF